MYMCTNHVAADWSTKGVNCCCWGRRQECKIGSSQRKFLYWHLYTTWFAKPYDEATSRLHPLLLPLLAFLSTQCRKSHTADVQQTSYIHFVFCVTCRKLHQCATEKSRQTTLHYSMVRKPCYLYRTPGLRSIRGYKYLVLLFLLRCRSTWRGINLVVVLIFHTRFGVKGNFGEQNEKKKASLRKKKC